MDQLKEVEETEEIESLVKVITINNETIARMGAMLQEHQQENDRLKNKMRQIQDWARAYPLDIFPEPALEKAATILAENDISLDSISAHVSRGIMEQLVEFTNVESPTIESLTIDLLGAISGGDLFDSRNFFGRLEALEKDLADIDRRLRKSEKVLEETGSNHCGGDQNETTILSS